MNESPPTIPREYVFNEPEFPLGINFNRAHPDYPLHRHDFEELVIVQKGIGINSVDGVDYPLQAGDVFVMPKGKTHAYSHMDHLRSYNLYFDLKQLNLYQWVTRTLPGFHALFTVEPSYRRKKEFNSRLRLSQENLIQIWSLAESLQITIEDELPGHRLIALGKFCELVGMLCRYYEETAHNDSKKVLRIAKAISCMESGFSEDISIDELAKIAHMSPRNFHRVFIEATGKTPAAHLIGLRVAEAAHQLKSTDKSITEIAFDCGFTDSNYFARAFRKTTGCSPSAYRKQTL
jgi:AraC family L-rhamnose operon transcriptional activator RhaR/AraC family L-rhamnose operon regulatory protein RhaS